MCSKTEKKVKLYIQFHPTLKSCIRVKINVVSKEVGRGKERRKRKRKIQKRNINRVRHSDFLGPSGLTIETFSGKKLQHKLKRHKSGVKYARYFTKSRILAQGELFVKRGKKRKFGGLQGIEGGKGFGGQAWMEGER